MRDTRYNTFWRRAGAGVIDGLVFVPIALVSVPLFLWANHTGNGWYAVAGSLLGGVPSHLYTIGFHWKRGQTIGKMATSVVVVDADTLGAISLRQAVLRSAGDLVIFVASLLITVYQASSQGDFHSEGTSAAERLTTLGSAAWFLAELLTMLTNDRRRAVHDLIGGTVVVKKEVLLTDALVSPGPAAQSAV